MSYDSQQPHAERVYRIAQDYLQLGLGVVPIFNYINGTRALEYSQVEEVALTMVEFTRAEVDVKVQNQGFKLNDLYGATANIENFINIKTLAGNLEMP